MRIFSFKPQSDSVKNWPVITVMLIVTTVSIFILQTINRFHFEEDTQRFCTELGKDTSQLSNDLMQQDTTLCQMLLTRLEQRPDLSARQVLDEYFWFQDRTEKEIVWLSEVIQNHYSEYKDKYTAYLGKTLLYFPHQPTLLSMFSSAVSHGDIWHLLSNLFFLLIFAQTLERFFRNSLLFAMLVSIAIVTSSVSYTLSVKLGAPALPALGLSGVIMYCAAIYAVLLRKRQVIIPSGFLAQGRKLKLSIWWFIGVLFLLDSLVLVLWITNGIHALESSNLVVHASGFIAGLLTAYIYRYATRLAK